MEEDCSVCDEQEISATANSMVTHEKLFATESIQGKKEKNYRWQQRARLLKSANVSKLVRMEQFGKK